MTLSTIGLEKSTTKELSDDLNVLLANFQVYYQNLRGVHWNIRGQHFFQLHDKFEELYIDAQEKVDMIAEIIFTLGKTPLHTFDDYLKTYKVKTDKNLIENKKSHEVILNSFQ